MTFIKVDGLHVCTHDVICPCCEEAKSSNKSIRKILDTNWIRIVLHYVNVITTWWPWEEVVEYTPLTHWKN